MTAPASAPEYGEFVYVWNVVGNPYGNAGSTTGVEYTVDIENLISGGYMAIAPGSVPKPYTPPLGSRGVDPLNPALGQWAYVQNNVGTPYGVAGSTVGVEVTTHVKRLVLDGALSFTLPPTSQYDEFPLYSDNTFASLGMVKDLMYAYYGGYDGSEGDYSHLILSQRLRDAIAEQMSVTYDPTVQALIDEARDYNADTKDARDTALVYRDTASTHATTATTQAGIATTKAGEAATSASTANARATTATTEADRSKTEADRSKDEADRSDTRATASATSATQAQGFRDTASTHADTAGTKAGIATTRAGEASTHADRAEDARTGVEDARTATEGYRDTALSHKNAAATSATASADHAADALAYRNTAGTHADTATTQAGIATTGATTATTQAGIATTKAGEASDSAGAAATSAGDAEDDRVLAEDAASVAGGHAAAADGHRVDAEAAAALAQSLRWVVRGAWEPGDYEAGDVVVWDERAYYAQAATNVEPPAQPWVPLVPAGGGGASHWDDLDGKPTLFPPEAHTHDATDVSGTATPLLDVTGASVGAQSVGEALDATTDASRLEGALTDQVDANFALVKLINLDTGEIYDQVGLASAVAYGVTAFVGLDAKADAEHTHTADEVTGAFTDQVDVSDATVEYNPGFGAGAATVPLADAVNDAAYVGRAANYTVNELVTSLEDAIETKADLDGNGKLLASQLPALAITEFLGAAASQAAMLGLSGQRGDWCVRTDLNTQWILTADNPAVIGSWREMVTPAAPVSSVAGRTGAVTLSKSDVGLSAVDNTSDANKPISTAVAAALGTKAASDHTHASEFARVAAAPATWHWTGTALPTSAAQVHAQARAGDFIVAPNLSADPGWHRITGV